MSEIKRTCAECGESETVETENYPMRCGACGEKFCPYCFKANATVRWVPLGCQGTAYHVTTCRPCREQQEKAESLHPEAV